MCPLFHVLLLSTAPSWVSASPSLTSPAFTYTHILNNVSPSSSRRIHGTHYRFCTASKLSAKPSPTLEEIHAESEQLRQEIKVLRAEALRRLEALEDILNGPNSPGDRNTSDDSGESSSIAVDAALEREGLLPKPPPIVIKKSNPVSSSAGNEKKVKKSVANLLDETTWNISLNIGREPGM